MDATPMLFFEQKGAIEPQMVEFYVIPGRQSLSSAGSFPYWKEKQLLRNINQNNASLAFGRTSAGSVWCFLGALWHNLRTFLICINKIMSFVTEIGRTLSYLFCLRKLKFTPFLGKKRVSENLWAKYEILGGLSICLGNIRDMFQLFGEKCPPLWAR